MLRARKVILWVIGASLASLLAIFLGFSFFRNYERRPTMLRGAVIKQDDDPIKQSPIMDVEISEANGLATTSTKSNFTGAFALPLIRGVGQNDSVTLRFLHSDYVPLELTELASDK